MADLSVELCGIRRPNPFWFASAPTNSGDQVMRAFDCGWGTAEPEAYRRSKRSSQAPIGLEHGLEGRVEGRLGGPSRVDPKE